MNRRKHLAFSRDVIARRKDGVRIGLLVVSLHDWKGGSWLDGRPEVCRVVLPADLAVLNADWSVCLALDVLICGSAPDDVFYDSVRSVIRAGAVSCWGEFSEGVALLSELPSGAVVAVNDPVPANRLGAALRSYRTGALALGVGGYRSRVFDPAWTAMFSPLIAEIQSAMTGVDQ